MRLAFLVGFGALLVLLMIEPEGARGPRPPAPPPHSVEVAVATPARPAGLEGLQTPRPMLEAPSAPEPSPAPAAATEPPEGLGWSPPVEFDTGTPPVAPPAPAEPSDEPSRTRLAGMLPVPEPARGPIRSPRVPVPDVAKPVPVAFPGPVVRRGASRHAAVALIVDDLGLSGPSARRAIRLPGPLTLAFLPYGGLTPELAREARAAGHEVFVHLPMEPVGSADPGPMALLSSLGADELRRRLLWAIGRVPGATGVNSHMGSRLTADPQAMAVVMGELARLGLPFVDSMTTAASIAGGLALQAGVPATARDVFLDNEPSPAAIRAQLERVERLARRAGSAVAIGHPYPATLEVLAEWLPRATRRGLRLVPATSMIELRGCSRELAGEGGCLLRATSEADGGESLPDCGQGDC